MIIRQWNARIDPTKAHQYEAFAHDRSLPMFRRHEGCTGVFFLGSGASRTVLTLWDDEFAIRRMEDSSDYQETVAAIKVAGFLVGDQSVELLACHDGFVNAWNSQE